MMLVAVTHDRRLLPVCCRSSHVQDALEQEVDAHRRESRIQAQRQSIRQKSAHFSWLVSRRLLTGRDGLCDGLWSDACGPHWQGRWMIDCFHDALHTSRRRVPMARCQPAPSRG